MRTAPRVVMASVLTGLVIVMSTSQDVVSQQPRPGGVAVAAGYGTNLDALRQWDAAVDRMTRNGDLVVMSRRSDRALGGRTHEYLAQFVAGIPVHGGGIARQLDRGMTVSLFGTMHQGIDIDITPQLSATAASAAIARQAGRRARDRSAADTRDLSDVGWPVRPGLTGRRCATFGPTSSTPTAGRSCTKRVRSMSSRRWVSDLAFRGNRRR